MRTKLADFLAHPAVAPEVRDAEATRYDEPL
jgi:hypothetical protein